VVVGDLYVVDVAVSLHTHYVGPDLCFLDCWFAAAMSHVWGCLEDGSPSWVSICGSFQTGFRFCFMMRWLLYCVFVFGGHRVCGW
jgi:hypothetical protein